MVSQTVGIFKPVSIYKHLPQSPILNLRVIVYRRMSQLIGSIFFIRANLRYSRSAIVSPSRIESIFCSRAMASLSIFFDNYLNLN